MNSEQSKFGVGDTLQNRHKAFTLIELIIVVMIISLVGFMVFSEAVKHTQKPEVLEPMTLKSTLKKLYTAHEEIEFICTKNTKKCFIAQNQELTPYNEVVDFGEDLELYIVDNDNQLQQLEEMGRVKDEKISLRYILYANGSTSELILKNSSGVYYLPTYFGETQKLEELEEAKEIWIKSKYSLKDTGDFY